MKCIELMELIIKFLNKNNNEECETFCNTYMDLFYDFSDDLEKEVPQNIFEIFDDINLVCDSYEGNVDIRADDKFCIDEMQLKAKIKNLYEKLDV